MRLSQHQDRTSSSVCADVVAPAQATETTMGSSSGSGKNPTATKPSTVPKLSLSQPQHSSKPLPGPKAGAGLSARTARDGDADLASSVTKVDPSQSSAKMPARPLSAVGTSIAQGAPAPPPPLPGALPPPAHMRSSVPAKPVCGVLPPATTASSSMIAAAPAPPASAPPALGIVKVEPSAEVVFGGLEDVIAEKGAGSSAQRVPQGKVGGA